MIPIRSKKGIEISSSMLVIIIIGSIVIAASFLVFGKFTNFLGEGSCDIKNVQFLGDLPNKLSFMSGPKGYQSRDTFSFNVPCGDRAYFVNLNKIKDDANAYKALDEEPLIKNEVDSSTGNNFFIMNGQKMVSAAKLDGLSLDYPYNLCFDTKSSRTVSIEMIGRGRDGVNVIPYCEQLECTQVPEVLQPDEKRNLVYTICGGTDITCKD
ncbi:hypothetical protein HYU10_05455, partial [Candidatus Woesearchaeota archaeon]|nr:hypothetical protein [Candidatus Woesearchaeota archaeon]